MITRRQANLALLSAASVAATGAAMASEPKMMHLPPARTSGGKPLTETLKLSMTMMCRQYGAVRSSLGRLMPNADHSKSDSTWVSSDLLEYSRVERRMSMR